jgi:hypothetical protein
LEPQEEHLRHRVAIVAEVDDFEASPSYLWNWAHDRSYEVARDLRRRGVKAMVLSVRMDSYLNQCDRKEGRTAPKARNLQITP